MFAKWSGRWDDGPSIGTTRPRESSNRTRRLHRWITTEPWNPDFVQSWFKSRNKIAWFRVDGIPGAFHISSDFSGVPPMEFIWRVKCPVGEGGALNVILLKSEYFRNTPLPPFYSYFVHAFPIKANWRNGRGRIHWYSDPATSYGAARTAQIFFWARPINVKINFTIFQRRRTSSWHSWQY